MSKGSASGRWKRVLDARRQARLSQGRDPATDDLFNAAPKRKATSTIAVGVSVIPPESPPRTERTEYVLTLGEAAARLGVGRDDLEAMIAAGKVEALPTGYTRTIPTREIARLQNS